MSKEFKSDFGYALKKSSLFIEHSKQRPTESRSFVLRCEGANTEFVTLARAAFACSLFRRVAPYKSRLGSQIFHTDLPKDCDGLYG